MTEKTVYIHYGSGEYHTPDKIENRECFTKPRGGMWASRKGDESGWKNWCEGEEFRLDTFDRFFEFTIRDGAKVLVLNDVDQLDNLPQLNSVYHQYKKNDQWSECHLNFEKLAEEYDAVELVNIRKFYFPLYGWDCNSILIMNPDIVEVVR